eukprot:CAMPEP_0185592308 /NCGR_PEP_ID=MMETSP0434-20130131/67486_1 /TAXON_ID=626734 ORGANISM="Favella taraikaensis, Strain Fe Narragansett Bay" /NCGR_SAMPLE_ID=MMETSP0434 /ASSEMBLY_ACC=CAM_ASM_000379 /LENGTH=330 /DNA_ID=CAMNT_0028218023 /DNA_START=1100 /DNA_END=2093 /DNA_ORIENTATION=-
MTASKLKVVPTIVIVVSTEAVVIIPARVVAAIHLLLALLRTPIAANLATIISATAAAVVVVLSTSLVLPRTRISTAITVAVVAKVGGVFMLQLLLLNENSVQFDVAVVHNQVFLHEAFEAIPVDDVERAVLAQTPHKALHALLIRLPLLDVPLHLDLRIRKLLVELFEVRLRLDHDGLLSYVGEGFLNDFVEPACLLDELLLYGEKVPVFADRLQQVVKELVELFAQVVADEDYVVPQGHLVLSQRRADRLVQSRLSVLYFLQRSLDLLLQALLKVELVQRAQGHYRVEQVGRVQAAGANVLGVFQTEQYHLFSVYVALLYFVVSLVQAT